MLYDVAAYLVLGPIAVVIAAGIGIAGWRVGRRAKPVRVAHRGDTGNRELTD